MEDIYIRKVTEGDVDAFRHLVRKYQHMAFSVAFSVVKDEFLAEDVVQEAFIKVFQKISTFRQKSKFSTWLYRIVINQAFRSLDKEKKWADAEIDETLEEPDYSSLDQLYDEERKFYVQETIKNMSPKEALAVRLFYLDDLSLEEIRDVTGWSQSNIKVVLHRGRKSFYNILNKLLCNEAKQII